MYVGQPNKLAITIFPEYIHMNVGLQNTLSFISIAIFPVYIHMYVCQPNRLCFNAIAIHTGFIQIRKMTDDNHIYQPLHLGRI